MNPSAASSRLSKAGDVCSIVGLAIAIIFGAPTAYVWIKNGGITVTPVSWMFGGFGVMVLAAAILQVWAAKLRRADATANNDQMDVSRVIPVQRANDLETCGKLRLASFEARRLREQLQMLGDRSKAEGVNIQSPYADSLFPPSGEYKQFYKDWADWQRSIDRYRTLLQSMTDKEPQSRWKTHFTEIVEALRDEEQNLARAADRLRSEALN
jgi:hypothetical protein